MDFKTELLTIRLTGGDIKPEKLTVGELTSLLKNYEKALKGIIARNSKGTIDEGKYHFSLVGVKDASAGFNLLAFSPKETGNEFRPALEELDNIISGRTEIADINAKTFDAVNHITGFLRNHKCNAECYYDNELITTVPKELMLGKEIPYITERTTVYGYVYQAGRDEKPHAEIKLLDGKILNIPVTIEDVSNIGKFLFRKIALEGESTVHPISFEILEFKLHEYIILEEDIAYVERIDKLKQLIGKSWTGIDPKTYLED